MAGCRQQSIYTWGHNCGIALDVGSHDRGARCHRLQEHYTHTLTSCRRCTEYMCAGEVTCLLIIRDIAGEDDIGPTCPLYIMLKTSPEATFSHEDKTCIGMSLTNSRNG